MPRLLVLLLLACSLLGCVGDSVSDNISTEISLTSAGSPGEVLEIRKRFRFSYDPRDARGVYFSEARVQILAPDDADLRYLQSVEIWVIDPIDASETLVGRASGFVPGDRIVPVEIVYPGDLRVFASDDSRVTFAFRMSANTWARPFPASGLTFAAAARIDIDI